ncbi:MAG: AtpZ/AtpI family protein [Alphaproteobacteria bacterium]|nr:MAG: AtpZ/AtpI family protein [Alphaproteobacteria bacterium]
MPKPARPSKLVGKVMDETGRSRAMAGFDIGLRLVVAVLMFGGLGLALDKWLGTLPWLMLLGLAGGFAGWMISMARRPR